MQESCFHEWVHRDQPGDGRSCGGALLQQAGRGGAVDQGREAGGEDAPPLLSAFPFQPGAARTGRRMPGVSKSKRKPMLRSDFLVFGAKVNPVFAH